jgi:hypothetical protein
MMRTVLLAAAAVAVIGAWAFGAAAQAPSSEEIHRLMGEKNYAQALQKITAGLALRGGAARAVNRYELLMLKGECHLQLKASSYAVDAFAAAAKDPSASAPERAVAAGYETLVRQAKGFAYTPRVAAGAAGGAGKARPAPIDILDPESRRRAFEALLADELAANEPKVAAAKASASLDPIAALFKPLWTMEGLERASTKDGGAPRVTALAGELTDRAKRILADALRGVAKRVGEIDKEANTFVETYQDVQDPFAVFPKPVRERVYKRKGLTDGQVNELRQAIGTCDRIPRALPALAEGLHAPGQAFEPFADEAARIRKDADRLLATDFMRVYKEIPKK